MSPAPDGTAALVLLTAAAFLAAMVSASLSIGGGYILFGAMTIVLPLPAAVALQSVLSYPSLVARGLTFRQDIVWRIVGPFSAGSVVGVLIGMRLYHAVPEALLSVAVGVAMLVLTWFPPRLRQLHGLAGMSAAGVLHAITSSLLGLGAILQPVLLHAGLSPRALVGTFATCLLVLEAMRTAGYAMAGFDYLAHLPVILLAIVAGFAGTWCGRRLIGHISERHFRGAMQLFITLLAGRLIVTGLGRTH